MTTTLNEGQSAAADGFFDFMLSDEKEMRISGPGGSGKTYLMGHMIDRILPEYHKTCAMLNIPVKYDEVVMTATTNKAAEVLSEATGRPVSTLHSFLGLKPQGDIETGATKLRKTNAWKVHERKVIFIDESSLMDTPIIRALHEATLGCKIVYIGDHCQLTPVMESTPPVFSMPIRSYELTQPMRNSGQPALLHLCNQWRHTVETGEFYPIEIVPGVVDHLDDYEMQAEIQHAFRNTSPTQRICAYTNRRVGEYNHHIRDMRGLPEDYQAGDKLINNSAVQYGKTMLRVEEEVEILRADSATEFLDYGLDRLNHPIQLEVRRVDLVTRFGGVLSGIRIPVDRDHFNALIRYFGKEKNWPVYFMLKETFPDLRPRDSCTLHKSQGSTYDTVYIDLSDVGTCRNADQVARLIYVGVSRARHRVVFYGQLPDNFGGPVVIPEELSCQPQQLAS